MKNFLLLSTLFASLFFIVNCSNKSSTNTAGTANATANGACPAGYYYSNGQCHNGDGTTNSSFNYNVGFYANNFGYGGNNTFTVTNITLMKQLFKLGMGVCDRASNNIGQANCDTWVTGQTEIIVQMPQGFASNSNSSAIVTIFAQPRINNGFNYTGSSGPWWQVLAGAAGIYLPDPKYYSGAYRNPLQIQSQLSLINNNQGFSVSGYGDAWTGYYQTVVTVEVTNGNENSSYADYILKVGGTEAARGRMARCQLQNCGI